MQYKYCGKLSFTLQGIVVVVLLYGYISKRKLTMLILWHQTNKVQAKKSNLDVATDIDMKAFIGLLVLLCKHQARKDSSNIIKESRCVIMNHEWIMIMNWCDIVFSVDKINTCGHYKLDTLQKTNDVITVSAVSNFLKIFEL